MRCVKETLPPRARARWLLMTMRLSQSSLTGTDRTLVAVGTVRLASMLATVRAGAPLRTAYVGSSVASASAFLSGSLGVGFFSAVSLLDVLVVGSFFAAGFASDFFSGFFSDDFSDCCGSGLLAVC